MQTRPRKIAAAASAFAALTAGTAVTSTMGATASPPTPLATKLEDLVRAKAMESGFFSMPPGTDTVSSLYALEPGAGTTWTAQKATSVIAVAEGAMTLYTAKGCAAKEYTAGQAAVVPAGKYRVVNTGPGPLEFAGLFAGLPKGGPQPLVGDAAPAPACKSAPGFTAASTTSSATTSEFLRGTQVPIAAYGKSLHALNAKGFPIEAGKDVLVGSYTALKGFSSGWITHMPAFAVVKSGTVTYYEARDGGCVKAEEYGPGQAYTHVGGMHMGVNENDQPLDFQVIYFNLPDGGFGSMVPVAGNTMDAIDFTPIPPAECPRLS